MITITGQTFQHRDVFKDLAGRWDGDRKLWVIDRRLSDGQIARLKGLIGCIVTIEAEPEPISIDWADDDVTPFTTDTPQRPPERRGGTLLRGDDPQYAGYFTYQYPKAFFGFSTLSKFTSYITHTDTPRRGAGWETGGSWSGTSTMHEALGLARDGWPQGLELAEAMIDALSLANPAVPKRKAALAGGSVNVGRMLAGDPAHMIRRPKQPGKKVVTFFVEAGANAMITGETLAVRAAAIAAIIDLMESVGYSCTIVTVDTSIHYDMAMYQLAVTLKEAGERLNLSDIMFALGHPAFLRRFSFAACSSVEETRPIWSTQGGAANAFDDEHRCGKSEFYIPVFTSAQQNTFTKSNNPLIMVNLITPDGLPIEIKGVDK